MIALKVEYRDRVTAIKSGNAVGVVSMLFENPVVIPRPVAERLGISDTGARKRLAKLAELGIIHEVAGVYSKAYGRGHHGRSPPLTPSHTTRRTSGCPPAASTARIASGSKLTG